MPEELAQAPIQRIEKLSLNNSELSFDILRLDQLHPYINGNKSFKLNFYLKAAKELGADTLVSMGGPFSNHLYALAVAGKIFDFKTKAFVRGEESALKNPTMQFVKNAGMELTFVSREKFRELRDEAPSLSKNEFWIPEGGAGNLGVLGAAEIWNQIPEHYDIICLSAGTGTTAKGLMSQALDDTHFMIYSCVSGNHLLEKEIAQYSNATYIDAALGGFAKWNPGLIESINSFYQNTEIRLDPIYTGKMIHALSSNWSPKFEKAKVLVIHTGGLQGIEGFEYINGQMFKFNPHS